MREMQYTEEAIVGAVIPESPAARYLEKRGRSNLKIEGKVISKWTDIGNFIQDKDMVEI